MLNRYNEMKQVLKHKVVSIFKLHKYVYAIYFFILRWVLIGKFLLFTFSSALYKT